MLAVSRPRWDGGKRGLAREVLGSRLPLLRVALVSGGRYGTWGATLVGLAAASLISTNFYVFGWPLDGLAGALAYAALLALIQLILLLTGRLAARLLEVVGALVEPVNSGPPRFSGAIREFMASWTVAAAATVLLVVWLSDEEGPLGSLHAFFNYEPLVIGGIVCGFVLGVGRVWLGRPAAAGLHPSARRQFLAHLPALVLAAALLQWAIAPGIGAPLPASDHFAGVVPASALADPSAPGRYEVVAASYGSGVDARRPEFGAQATWTTPSFDASAALPARGSIVEGYERWYWGFDTAHLPINGLVWYPRQAQSRAPLVLIAHGNHTAGQSSHPGFAYLGEHLASRGFVVAAIDANFLNGDAAFDYGGAEQGVRAWLLLRHLDEFAAWDRSQGHPLAGRLDLDRVALIGHSRGGEAAAVAAMLNEAGLTPRGLPSLASRPGIRAVVAIAPSTRQYSGVTTGSPQEVDYMVIQGAMDGDLVGYVGLQTYHQLRLNAGQGLKVALYAGRANHGRFNSVWNDGDAGLSSWMLDRSAVLQPAEQERLAKATITAFLARSLLGQTAYDAFFRDPRSGREWLPDDVLLSHWETGKRIAVSDFGRAASSQGAEGFTEVTRRDPGLRDGDLQNDTALLLRWSGAAALRMGLDAVVAAPVDDDWSVALAVANVGADGRLADVEVVVSLRDGRSSAVRLAAVSPRRPSLPTNLWKLPWLGARYLPTEPQVMEAEPFLQTHAVPLRAFDLDLTSDQAAEIAAITLRFEGEGALFLDDVALEPPVPGEGP